MRSSNNVANLLVSVVWLGLSMMLWLATRRVAQLVFKEGCLKPIR